MSVKAILLWILAAVLLVVALALYRIWASENQLQVDPQATHEIEKAKSR
jgi:hypothetical protein